jgi:hypothetical protein
MDVTDHRLQQDVIDELRAEDDLVKHDHRGCGQGRLRRALGARS